MDDQYVISTAGTFVLSLIILILFINRRHTETGRYVGIVPIAANGLRYLYPALSCQSDNGLACEWAGIWVFLFSCITIFLLIVFSLFAKSIINNHSVAYLQNKTLKVPLRHSFGISMRTIAILLVFVAASGVMVKLGFDLFNKGYFTTWRYLGRPPDLGRHSGEKAIDILSYNLRGVQIETNQNRTFKTDLKICSFLNRKTSNCWYYGVIEPGSLSTIDNDCKINVFVPYLIGDVTERVEVSSCHAPSEEWSIFVLRSDGSVFVWHHKAHRDIYTFLFFLGPGILGGLALGVSLIDRFQKKLGYYLFLR